MKIKFIFLLLFLIFGIKINAQCDYEKNGSIIISEVYFDSQYDENLGAKHHSFGEFIELYNSSNQDIDLTGWSIRDNRTKFTFNPLVSNTTNTNNYIIKAGGFKIITYDGYWLTAARQRNSPDEGYQSRIGGKAKFIELFPEATGREQDIILQDRLVLYNQADRITLRNPEGKIISDISYLNAPTGWIKPLRSASSSTSEDPKTYLKINDFTVILNPIIENKGRVYNYRLIQIHQIGDPILDERGEQAYDQDNYPMYYQNITETFTIQKLQFNYPIGYKPLLDSSGFVVMNNGLPSLIQDSNLKRGIYLTPDNNGFYTIHGALNYQVAVATPFTLPFAITLANIDPDLFNDEPTSDKINLTESISYDIKTGNINGQSKSFFDRLGKITGSMSKDFVTNKIWGSEVTYDEFGRKSKESFPVTGCSNFFKTSFLTNPTHKTDYLDKYYSNTNTDEPYQATATQPYSEINYDKLNPGNVINVVGGNQIDGVWKTGQAYTVPAAQEMYYLYGYNYFEGPINANNEEEIVTKFYKSVGVDANGNENVSFSDGEGKLLATARSGGTNGYPVHSLIGTQGYVDVHIPKGIESYAVTLIGDPSQYKIYDLKTGLITTTPMTGGNAYRIEALVPPTTESKVYVLNNPLAATLSYSLGALGVSYAVNYYDFSLNVYNKTGQLVKNVQPNGVLISHFKLGTKIKDVQPWMLPTATAFVSTYIYNDQGLVKQSTSPDQGMSTFAYRQDGQIRYSQSALQRIAPAKISYTDYDSYGRPVESGVMLYAATFNSLIPDNAIPSGTRSEQTFTVYDYNTNNVTSLPLATTQSLSALLTASGYTTTQIATYTQKNLSGNVAITYTKPAATITAITWYSYDIYGRAEWVIQYNDGIGTKIIDYEYDYKGNVKKVLYQKNKPSEMFVHQYTYDANDVLKKVETSSNNTTFDTHADYSYYATGELKRLNIAQGAQGLDYVYTLGGALKSINHPSLEQAKDPGNDPNDVFGVILDYYNGDYQRANTNIASSPSMVGTNQDFIGNIKAARFSNKKVAGDFDPGTGTANQKAYTYTYNRNNWLTQAKFGTTNNTGTITNPPTNRKGNFYEGGLTYDANGNIITLTRTGNTGAVTATTDALTTDQLRYSYNGNNQLQQVVDSALPTPTDPTDIEGTTNYTYDAIGQLTSNSTENLNYFYNTQGLVTEVRKGANAIVKFYYNERGQRIKKESFNSIAPALLKTEYYVLDLAGNLMSLYTQLPAAAIIQQELPIYGLSRLGVYSKTGNTFSYQITDHLGNVRAVINKIPGNPVVQVVSFADYYPFGEQLPGRNSNAGNYRYAFQGQEKDPETGMEAFQLRLWDGRIGRWLTTDPYGEFDSPYLGMGNNPINLTDPDGGSTEDCCPDPPPIQLQEVVVYSTRVAKPRDIGRDLSFIPKAPIFNFAIAPRASDDWWWNKLAYDGSRYAEHDGWRYKVNNDGFAVKGLGPVPLGGTIPVGLGGGGSISNLFKTLKNPNVLKHIFRNSTGHVNPASIESKARYLNLFNKVASNSKNLINTVNAEKIKNGVQTYQKVARNGKQIWVETIGGKITNAGVNSVPR